MNLYSIFATVAAVSIISCTHTNHTGIPQSGEESTLTSQGCIPVDNPSLAFSMGSGCTFGTVQNNNNALEGRFYDLKQRKNGVPSDIANAQNRADGGKMEDLIDDFTAKGWNACFLSKYYISPSPLYASEICIPAGSEQAAAQAFGCADRVKPSGWMAVYRGKVRAPKNGKFRFVGTGSGVLKVRFNRDIVLDSGFNRPIFGIGSGQFNETGTEFTVKEGYSYPLEILIAEIPGCTFSSALMIQETTNSKKGNMRIFSTDGTKSANSDSVSFIWKYLP